LRCPSCLTKLANHSVNEANFCALQLQNVAFDCEMLPEDWVHLPVFDNLEVARKFFYPAQVLPEPPDEAATLETLRALWGINAEAYLLWLAEERGYGIVAWPMESIGELPLSWQGYQSWQGDGPSMEENDDGNDDEYEEL